MDDTDSVRGNCTTFLATEIIRELSSDFDLIGNPRLVRLNPAVPWKTRGNGSLILRFGKGAGERHLIGRIDGKDLYCYDEYVDVPYERQAILERIIPLVESLHESDADPGLIVSDERPSYEFYE
ncbi:MAG: DNA-binding protein, partial [Candidatus Methanomethylophilaceae archaeon]|nr:DNA-binding protein [Candidatus Methanomethylophilaceae archaeon]